MSKHPIPNPPQRRLDCGCKLGCLSTCLLKGESVKFGPNVHCEGRVNCDRTGKRTLVHTSPSTNGHQKWLISVIRTLSQEEQRVGAPRRGFLVEALRKRERPPPKNVGEPGERTHGRTRRVDTRLAVLGNIRFRHLLSGSPAVRPYSCSSDALEVTPWTQRWCSSGVRPNSPRIHHRSASVPRAGVGTPAAAPSHL